MANSQRSPDGAYSSDSTCAASRACRVRRLVVLPFLIGASLLATVGVTHQCAGSRTDRTQRSEADHAKQRGDPNGQGTVRSPGTDVKSSGDTVAGIERYASVTTSAAGADDYVRLDVPDRGAFWNDCHSEIRANTRALLVEDGADLAELLSALTKPERIEVLDIRCVLTARAVRLLQSFSGLRVLNLSSVPNSGEVFAALPALISVRLVSLNARGIDRIGAALEQFPALQTLVLWGPDLSRYGSSWLTGVPDLRRVWLYECAPESTAFAALQTLRHLEYLDIWAREAIDARGFEAIFACQSLKHLSVEGFARESQDWTKVQQRSNLTSLGLLDFEFGSESARALLKFEGLRALRLGGSTWEGVVSLPATLRVLNLRRTGFGDAQAVALTECNELTSLDLGSSRISNASAKVIASLRSLQSLSLARCSVDGEFLRALPSSLVLLDLSGTRVDDTDLRELANRTPRLSTLLLYGTSVTADGILFLARLPELRSIRLPGGDMSASELASLRARFTLIDD